MARLRPCGGLAQHLQDVGRQRLAASVAAYSDAMLAELRHQLLADVAAVELAALKSLLTAERGRERLRELCQEPPQFP